MQCKNIFYENSGLRFTNAVKHNIRTTGDDLVYSKSYMYAYHLKQEFQSQIQ